MTDDVLADLQRRVAALEAAADPGPPAAEGPDTAAGTDVLWALAGLRQRVADPGAVVLVGSVALPDGRRAEWQEGRTVPDLLEREWDAAADVLAALGHPVRLRLLQRVLGGGAATAGELTEFEGEGTTGRTYHHLRQLVAAGWLVPVGGGRYQVPVVRVVPLLGTVVAAGR